VRNPAALALAAAAALFAGSGCSSLRTNVDYDPATNFGSFKTYAFKDVHGRGEFQMKRVEAAIEKVLTAKGLAKTEVRAEVKPDLWVVLHARMKNDKQITSYNAGWGWGWHGWGGGGISTARVYDVPVGTLIVDLVDTKEKELVWRGVASRDVGDSETPQERAEVTQQAIDKLFEKFPPGVPPKP
jgi:hypothetical protein